MSTYTTRHFLGLKGVSAEEITSILDRAAYWEQYPSKVTNQFQGKFVSNLFFENSTRTRFSFELAQKRLGAEVLNFSAAESSVQKGESIYDTVRTLGIHGHRCRCHSVEAERRAARAGRENQNPAN